MATATVKLTMTKAALVDSRTPDVNNRLYTGDTVLLHRDEDNDEHSFLYIGFDSLPSSLKHKKLIGIESLCVIPQATKKYFVGGLDDDFDADAITYNNRPAHPNQLQERLFYYAWQSKDSPSTYYHWLMALDKGWIEHPDTLTTIEKSRNARNILRNRALALYNSVAQSEYEVTLYGEYYSSTSGIDIYHATPWIYVTYDDGADLTSQITPSNNTSGYLNPAAAQTFYWTYESSDGNYVCAGDWAQASATFYWKKSSDSTYNSVAISGTTTSVTIPAGTFPSNASIDWYVQGTDDAGTTTRSSVYTISTVDAAAVATAVSPLNTVEDGNSAITFNWSLSNAYGNDPSRVVLQWDDDGTWTTLIDSSDPITSYTAAAGTFTAGEISWRVVAYNQDDVIGAYSTGLFVCVAAPQTPNGINCDGVPYATITWQCSGQQAFQITIDGVDYGVKFGTDKSFTLDEPLSNGTHTVSIIAQGVYGLWSQAGTATITIGNTTGDSLTLTVTGTSDADLVWETEDTDLDFYIYRDGVKIGHTTSLSFTDRLALGQHTYYVLNKLPDGNYTKSNAVTVTLETDRTLIASYPPKAWLNIELTENSNNKQNFSYQKTVSSRHFLGANYPVVEMSSFEDSTATYNTAAMDMATAKSFENLKGKVVCIKSRMGIVFVGVMNVMQKSVNRFYAAYTISVKRLHYEDYFDDTLT